MNSIIIMAGGTGGHVFPALAVAKQLQQQNWQVSWLGTKAGLESTVVEAQGIAIDYLAVRGFRGKSFKQKASTVVAFAKSLVQAWRILSQRRPTVVLGMGGYVAAPGAIVAKLLGIKLLIHEQNTVVGGTNRLLQVVADKTLQGFPNTFARQRHAIHTGNPLRPEFSQQKPLVPIANDRPLRLLVVGGSLGASVLNQLMPKALALLQNIEVMHQSGSRDLAQVTSAYQKHKITAQTLAFIDDIADAYHWADAIVCRSGAMTISEIAAVGLPSILVPYPFAIDDHQTSNAKILSSNKAAILLPQDQCNDKSLATACETVRNSFAAMSVAAAKQAKPQATQLVVNIIEELAS